MKWIADTSSPRVLHGEIEQELLTNLLPGGADSYGYALYIWENGEGLADEMQDDLETAIEGAYERYGIPMSAWKKVE